MGNLKHKVVVLLFFLALGCAPAFADGRLLATGGVTEVEGAAGGGLTPWAVLAGYGTEAEVGGTFTLTRVATGDYSLDVIGAAYTFNNRIEVSFARQEFDLGSLPVVLGDLFAVPPAGNPFFGQVLRQDVLGVKVRLYGDVIYSRWPQVSVGVQYKRHKDFAIPQLIGARDDAGTDFYLSATKVWLAGLAGRNLLVNATLRSTAANQMGLLGFGGDRGNRDLAGEASIAVLLNPQTVVGFEYRQKPDNLSFAREDDWRDAFIAYFPSKNLSFVVAYADLGSIAGLDRQTGMYFSVQAGF